MSLDTDINWEGLPEIYYIYLRPHCPHCMEPVFVGQRETHRVDGDSTLYIKCPRCRLWSAATQGRIMHPESALIP